MKYYLIPEIYLPVIYIVVSIFLYFIIKRIIKASLSVRLGRFNIKERREKTLVNLIQSIAKYIIYFIVIVLILDVYGINTKTLLAGLGIMGLVIGLAIQDTIKDFLAGFFIIFDDQYAIGDIVEIKGFKGEVIGLGLKTTKIKGDSGKIKIIANHTIGDITNYSLSELKLNIDLTLDGNEKIDKHLQEIKDVLIEKLNKNILGVGFISLGNEVVYRFTINVYHQKLEEVKRIIYTELNNIIKKDNLVKKVVVENE